MFWMGSENVCSVEHSSGVRQHESVENGRIVTRFLQLPGPQMETLIF